MRALRLLVVQSLIAIVTITIAPAYCRGDVVYQADFEEPSFTPGLLDGQDEWRTKFGIDAAMITDVQPRAGVQSIQMDGEAAMPNGGLVVTVSELLLNYDPVVNNFPIINIRVDVRLDGPSTDSQTVGRCERFRLSF